MNREKWQWTPSILRQARTISSREPLVNIDEKFFEAQLRHRMCHMGFTAQLQMGTNYTDIHVISWDDGSMQTKSVNIGRENYRNLPRSRDIIAFFPNRGYGADDRYVMQLKVGAAPYPTNKTWTNTYNHGPSDLRSNLQQLSDPDSGVDAFCFCSDELFYLQASEGAWKHEVARGAPPTTFLGVTEKHGNNIDGDPNTGLFPPYDVLIAEPGRIVHFTGLWDDPCDDDRKQDPVTLHGVAVAVRITGLKPCNLVNLQYRSQHLYASEHQHDTDDNGGPKYRCSHHNCDSYDAEGSGVARSTVQTHWSRDHKTEYPPEYRRRGNNYRISVILGSEPQNCPECYPIEEE